MKRFFVSLLSSFKFTQILLIVTMFLLAVATFFEKYYGANVARCFFYHSPILYIPIMLLCANFLFILSARIKAYRGRVSFILTHCSFILIIIGAFVTHFFSFEGVTKIREGESTNMVAVQRNNRIETVTLPFYIKLNDFIVERYPGSSSPSSYRSCVTVIESDKSYDAEIFMNNVLQVSGYRFYQMSFDRDELGTVLSVNYDPVGRPLTYAGYILLAAGLMLSLIGKRGRMAQLWRGAVSIVALLSFSLPVAASENSAYELVSQHKIPCEHASKFGELAVQHNGRVKPVRVLAGQLLAKISNDGKLHDFNSEQFVISVWAFPELWSRVPIIAVGNDALADEFGLTAGYCSFNEAFDTTGQYKLYEELNNVYSKDALHRSSKDKALLALDERFNIFSQMMNGGLLSLFPAAEDVNMRWITPADDLSTLGGGDSLFVDKIDDWYISEVRRAVQTGLWRECDKIVDMMAVYQRAKASPEVYSESRIRGELLYTNLEPFRWSKIAYLLLGFLAFVVGLVKLKWGNKMRTLIFVIVTMVGVLHLAGYLLRCYIAGHVAMSNSYETMILLSLIMAVVSMIMVRKNFMAFALGLLFSGVILFVSKLSWNNPQITPLVPVLKSAWLMFHVAFIMGGYALFGFSAILGAFNLVQMALEKVVDIQTDVKALTRLNELSMWIGLILTTIGIFMGAVWADNSWGRYWGWDPKETWALITMLAYVAVTHLYLLKLKRYNFWLNLLSLLAVLVVLMTYFGVNMLLSGMHSYA